MNVKLIIERGAPSQVLNLRPPVAVIGRARGNAVRIPSAEVSRHHCQLLLQDGVVQIEDLGSVNGTLLNGKQIRRVEYVGPGDRLSVGPVTFSIEYTLSTEARQRLRKRPDAAKFLKGLEELEDLEEVQEVSEDEDIPEAEAVPEAEPLDELELVDGAEFNLDLDLLPADDEDGFLPPLQDINGLWEDEEK